MPTVAEILQYYINLLIIQYVGKPNIEGTLSTVVGSALSENITFDVMDGFDLDTATGVQLDTIGKYIGINRFYTGQSFTGPLFAFVEYTDLTADTIQEGFSEYADFDTKAGSWIQYDDIVSGSQALGDDDYRAVLKFKIIQNNINHSHQSIDDGLFDAFGTSVRADSSGNMEMVYFVPTSASLVIQVAREKEVLPRPMGVKLSYVIESESNFFGFATYSGVPVFATGFSTFSDFDSKAGNVLTYNKLTGA